MPSGKCGKCTRDVTALEAGLCCDGLCEKWYHISCVGLTDEVYMELQEDSESKWYCPTCAIEPYRTILNELKELQYYLFTLSSGTVPDDLVKKVPNAIRLFKGHIFYETNPFLTSFDGRYILKREGVSEEKVFLSNFALMQSQANWLFGDAAMDVDKPLLALPMSMTESPTGNDESLKCKTTGPISQTGPEEKRQDKSKTNQEHRILSKRKFKKMDIADVPANGVGSNSTSGEKEVENQIEALPIQSNEITENSGGQTVAEPPVTGAAAAAQPPSDTAEKTEAGSDVYEVEDILDHMHVHGKTLFLVKWKNYTHDYNSWEYMVDLGGCKLLISKYYRRSLFRYDKLLRECREQQNGSNVNIEK